MIMQKLIIQSILLTLYFFNELSLAITPNQKSKLLIAPASNVEEFSELFLKQREIHLQLGDNVIGEISKVEISSEGNLLLLDTKFGDVFLINNSGKLIKKLGVEKALPGYSWHPLIGSFAKDGEIIIWGGRDDFLLFDKLGEFNKKFSIKNSSPFRSILFDDNKNILMYSLTSDNLFLTKMDITGKELENQSMLPVNYFNYIYRFEEGGSCQMDTKNKIYVTHLCEPKIYQYSPELKLMKTFHHRPSFFKTLPTGSDQLFKNAMQNFVQIQKVMKSVTQNLNLFAINDTLLLSQYLIGAERKFGLDICSTNGNYFSSDRLRYEHPILGAINNLIYVAQQPEMNQEGELPNPILIEYKVKFNNNL